VDAYLESEVLSSKIRLGIASALSLRPRTLGELADITGISVQGVIRHLKRLESLGLVDEKRMKARTPKARLVYVRGGLMIGDYTTGDLTVVKAMRTHPSGAPSAADSGTPEQMAADLIVQRRRVREQARRLGRAIDELVGYQGALESALEGLNLTQEERLILEVVLTEETIEDGRNVLSRYYGLEDRRSIDEVLTKARRIVK
jgi:DNA-binding transcriptional ArsR family regulator